MRNIIYIIVPLLAACSTTGTASGLVGQVYCSGARTFDNGARVVAAHYRHDFSDGSSMVSCEAYVSNGPVYRKDSAPRFYRPDDIDSADGKCKVVHTITTETGNGSGSLDFAIPVNTASGKVVYRDLENPLYHNATIPLSCQAPYP